MKNLYYVVRRYREDSSATGYTCGRVHRFGTLVEADAYAVDFAGDVLPRSPYDHIAVGIGRERYGFAIGRGHCIATYVVNEFNGEIIRIDYVGLPAVGGWQ